MAKAKKKSAPAGKTVKKTTKTSLLDLPFDQYSRQYIVTKLINEGVRKNGKKLSIIDLGGHKGKTHEFLPNDKVTIIDVFDEEYPGYVKGDATNMDFADDAFDIAVSFDVFEHIPRPRRLSFIKEALRVSKYGAFIAMPVDQPEHATSQAEYLLNDMHKLLYGEEHPWLKEHIDYRIPSQEEVETLLKKAKAPHVWVSSNQIVSWQLLQSVIFLAARNANVTKTANDLNKWYNKNIHLLEDGYGQGYRGIYFISNDKNVLAAVGNALDNYKKHQIANEKSYVPVHQATLEQLLKSLAQIGREFVDRNGQYAAAILRLQELEALTKQVRQLKANLEKSSQDNEQLQKELADVYQSASWRITKPLRNVKSKINKDR